MKRATAAVNSLGAGDAHPAALTGGQEAALARLGCALEAPGAVAVLCGPAGVGTTTVLDRLAATLLGRRTVEHASVSDWLTRADADWPHVALVDDAHDVDAADIDALLARLRSRHPHTGLVLAGRGRLLTLLARAPDAEASVALRAVLHPFTPTETRALLAADQDDSAAATAVLGVADAIHEIAAGIPAVARRLGTMAGWLAASRPDHAMRPADVEALHRRVSLAAA
jgi:hypothetical protein